LLVGASAQALQTVSHELSGGPSRHAVQSEQASALTASTLTKKTFRIIIANNKYNAFFVFIFILNKI
jgi:hypothetical protein